MDLEALDRIMTSIPTTHFPILLNFQLSDENMLRRRAGEWLDPLTQILYPGDQIVYSRKRRAEGYKDGKTKILNYFIYI